MTYIMYYKKPVIEEAKSIVLQLDPDMEKTLSKNSMRQELIIMGKLQQDSDAFTAVVNDGKVTVKDKDGNESEQKLSSIDASFVPTVNDFAKTFVIGGTNLSETPNINPTKNSTVFLFLIPILSGLMQLAMTIYMQYMQKKRNPAMPSMGAMNAMLYFMPLFSVWLAFTVPAGVGFYWIWSALFSFFITFALNHYFTPERTEAINEKEKEKARIYAEKHPEKKTFMQRMLEQQELANQQNSGKNGKKPNGEKASRSEMNKYNRDKIKEARKRMAEKYGDVYDDNDIDED
jgi:YidC/Oxa1 family membrane protein insertase